MELLRKWVAGITVTAILAAIARALTDKSGQRGAVRLFCGVCVALAILMPLRTNAPRELLRSLERSFDAQKRAASYSQETSEALARDYAAAQAAAYLEAQAAAIADGITFSLELSEDLTPVSVTVSGPAAAREAASALAAQALGLSGESIRYISVEEEDADGKPSISRMDAEPVA